MRHSQAMRSSVAFRIVNCRFFKSTSCPQETIRLLRYAGLEEDWSLGLGRAKEKCAYDAVKNSGVIGGIPVMRRLYQSADFIVKPRMEYSTSCSPACGTDVPMNESKFTVTNGFPFICCECGERLHA